MKTVLSTFVAAVATMLACTLAVAADAPGAKVDYEGNLSKIPAADPAPTDVPPMVEAMKGRHPRLLFTTDEIAELKKQIETDPLLKKTYEGKSAWAKRTKAPAGNPPDIVTSDTPALVTSVGRLPTLAYMYALDRDPDVKQAIIDTLQVMLDQPHWADTAELDSNMGAGNNMFMVALLFDTVYDELEPEFRLKVAKKILLHVRRMYYLGHKQLSLMPIKYWQQDTQNNHRWHRNAGMAACLLSIADIKELDSGYLLQEFKKEMDFVLQWYPADGDCHEGAGYQTFGFFYLAAAARMMDRVLGTHYLDHPGFRNAWAQHLYYWAPGRNGYMTFGDAPNNQSPPNHLDAAFFISPALSRDKKVQAALVRQWEARAKDYPWTLFAMYDPTVGEGDYKAVPTHYILADLGAASIRDSWEPDAVLFTFKCGPYGGYKLNEYRYAYADSDGKPHYVNIAHDDPDANSFALGTDGDFLFHPGNYATKKITETANSITVDGKGQLGEGDQYTQPVPNVDMRTLSYLTGWKVGDAGRIIVEGEAANAYPTLKQFRRTALWMPGEYLLILDNVAADGRHTITWRGTAEKAQFDKPEDGRCHAYTKSGKRVDFQMLANKEFNGSIDYLMLSGRWTQLLMQQFQFFLDTDAVRFACLMDPWKKKVGMTMKDEGDTVTITVTGDGINDTWTWKPAADLTTPSSLAGTRDGKPLVALTAKDVAPQGDAAAKE